ncbi:GntR family transcriptional regulator [Streptomyces sp. 846.5]|nr:GntR family transcriptional regulator [Streptomyces sp. 846.5]TDT94173.1 GntR family transcriptional regulator [Streptomyces sp. 846.5]
MADSTSEPEAPYLRVAAAIRDRITAGTWMPGDRLPSRTVLGQEWGVGENVVRRAQELLISHGLLEGRAGAGTYVREPRNRHRMLRTWTRDHHADSPFRTELASLGMDASWESDSTAKVPAPESIARRLGIATGDPCVRTGYEFFADRQPVMLSTSWEPMAVTGGSTVVLPEGGPLAGAGVVARMAAIGITVTRVVELPRPVQATREQAHLLGVAAGTAATCIERTYYDTTGRAVETADILVPTEHWDLAYEFDLQTPAPAAD